MNFHIIYLPYTTSTNEYAKNLLRNNIPLPTLIYTDYQTQGKGQQNNVWHSQPQKNLLCSLILPISISTHHSFYISQWASLLVFKILEKSGIPPSLIRIKWPNDLIIHTQQGYKKIAGILIENHIEQQHITSSIIGIGINVNQTSFLQLTKSATSIKLITHHEHPIPSIIHTLTHTTNVLYPLIELQQFTTIQRNYCQYLYGWQTPFLFKTPDHHIHKGTITNIHPNGQITILTNNNQYAFTNKDIQFLL